MNLPGQNSELIRKLLCLKRYEQPPPGFFVHFAEKVAARLDRDDVVESQSLWSWVLEKLEVRPTVACAYATLLSSLLFSGFWLSQAVARDAGARSLHGVPLTLAPSTPMFSKAEPVRALRFAPTDLTFTSPSAQSALRPQLATDLLNSNPFRVRPAAFSY